MATTDFILSFLTGAVDDNILDELISSDDNDVKFTIFNPDKYWAKQQIKDSYKTPDGGYNKSKFDNDYEVLTQKFVKYDFQKFGESYLKMGEDKTENKTPMFQDGKTLPYSDTNPISYRHKVDKNHMSEEEYYGSGAARSFEIARRAESGKYSSGKVQFKVENNVRYINNTAGNTVTIPDAYTAFSGMNQIDLAKGKTVSELAFENPVRGLNGELITPTFFDKFNPKYANQIISVDKDGKFERMLAPSGTNLDLQQLKGYTKDGNAIIDKVTSGEHFFGPQVKDKYKFEQHDWVGLKAPLYIIHAAEGFLKGGWNAGMGMGAGMTEGVRMTTKLLSGNEEAPKGLNNVKNFFKANELRTDVRDEQRDWYSPVALSYSVSQAVGTIGVLAAGTFATAKLGGKAGMNKKAVEIATKYGTSGLFALWGAEQIPTLLEHYGITDPKKQAAVYIPALIGLGLSTAATNIMFKNMAPNLQKDLLNSTSKNVFKEMESVLKGKMDDAGMKEIGKSFTRNFANKVMESSVAKSAAVHGFKDESVQEGMEAVIPDVAMFGMTKMWNGIADLAGWDKSMKFNFNEEGESAYNDFASGKNIAGYFEQAAVGGLAGGIMGPTLGGSKKNDNNNYIFALSNEGTDFSNENVDKNFEDLQKALDKALKDGKAGPLNAGLDPTTFKTVAITEENKGKVKSFGEMMHAQATQDLKNARDMLVHVNSKGGFLFDLKEKWETINKATNDIEGFNKFALNQTQMRIANGVLMGRFKTILEGSKGYAEVNDIAELIKKRNTALSNQLPDKAKEYQDQIIALKDGEKGTGKTSEKTKTSVDLSPEAWKEYDEGKIKSDEYHTVQLASLTNGVAFAKAMQVALASTQVNPDIDFDGKTFVSPLSAFMKSIKRGKETSESITPEGAVNRLNRLNMTSMTSVEEHNEQIDIDNVESEKYNAIELAERDKEQKRHEDETGEIIDNIIKISERGPQNSEEEAIAQKFDLRGFDKTALLETLDPEGDFNQSLFDLVSSLRNKDLQRTPQPTLTLKSHVKLQEDENLYFNRVNILTEKFESLGTSLRDYIHEVAGKHRLDEDGFIDDTLGEIIQELEVRIAQVHLNFGTNRRMKDAENSIFPILTDLLGKSKDSLTKEYTDKKNEIRKKSKVYIKSEGSKIFLSIEDEVLYNKIVNELKALLRQTKNLKAISDNNTPTIDILRIQDDLDYAMVQIELYQKLFIGTGNEPIITELTTLSLKFSDKKENDNWKKNTGLVQKDVDEAVTLLYKAESITHHILKKADTEADKIKLLSNIDAEKERIKALSFEDVLKSPHTTESFESYIDNIATFNVYQFAKEFNADLVFGEKEKIPSFTQTEAIKHGYWNLKREDLNTGSNHLQNMVSISGYQGSGKTEFVGKEVARLYILFRKNNSLGNILTDGRNYQNGVFKAPDGETNLKKLEIGSGIALASKYQERLFSLREAFHTGDNNKVKTVLCTKDSMTKQDPLLNADDFIETGLIPYLKDSLNNNSNIHLIVVDESTLISGEQLEEINEALRKINLVRKTNNDLPIKILFLGDMKQAGDVTGLQGEFKTVHKDGGNKFSVNTGRQSKFTIRTGKELRARFRTGNVILNKNIDYLRNRDYMIEDKVFESEYYQGSEGLAGFKLSGNNELDLKIFIEAYKNKKLDSNGNEETYVIVAGSLEEKERLSNNPDIKASGLDVLTIHEIQGRTFSYGHVVSDPKHVYAYTQDPASDTKPGNIHEVIRNDGTGRIEGSSMNQSFFNYNGEFHTDISTESLDYQFGFELISVIGRFKKYCCVVSPVSHGNEMFEAELGSEKSKATIKEVRSFSFDLTSVQKRTNRKHIVDLFEKLSALYVNDDSQTLAGTNSQKVPPIVPKKPTQPSLLGGRNQGLVFENGILTYNGEKIAAGIVDLKEVIGDDSEINSTVGQYMDIYSERCEIVAGYIYKDTGSVDEKQCIVGKNPSGGYEIKDLGEDGGDYFRVTASGDLYYVNENDEYYAASGRKEKFTKC